MPARKYVRTKMNRNRAKWAKVGVMAFGREVFNDPEGEGMETVIGDFLADLMHYCHQRKLDFDHLLERGRNHFECEFDGREL